MLTSSVDGPKNLTELVTATGLPRATAHRLAVALAGARAGPSRRRRKVRARVRAGDARPGCARQRARWRSSLVPPSTQLRDETEESAQLYVPRRRPPRLHRVARVASRLAHDRRRRRGVAAGRRLRGARTARRPGSGGRVGRERRGTRGRRGVGERAGSRPKRRGGRGDQRVRSDRAHHPPARSPLWRSGLARRSVEEAAVALALKVARR